MSIYDSKYEISRDLNVLMEISILRFPFTYHVIQKSYAEESKYIDIKVKIFQDRR